ncbi:MAG: hypothetical protein WDN45_04100 [Caulobacteraceae bacterium]
MAQSTCDAGLTALGITANQIPVAYGPDEVWSYEVGEKARVLMRQETSGQRRRVPHRLEPGAGHDPDQLRLQLRHDRRRAARSEGFDLQTQFRPIQPLTLTLNASYHQRPLPDRGWLVRTRTWWCALDQRRGRLRHSKWQRPAASIQYDRNLWATYSGYVRLDHQWQDRLICRAPAMAPAASIPSPTMPRRSSS